MVGADECDAGTTTWLSPSNIVFGAFIVLIVVTGWTGLADYFHAEGGDAGAANVAYGVVTLFFANGLLSSGDVPLPLEFAQLAAPIATGIATVKVFRVAIEGRFRAWRARARTGHTVVVGAGATGLIILRQLAAADPCRVVAVDRQPSEAARQLCHRPGWSMVIGDAGDESTLRRCSAASARLVFVATGHDSTDIFVARRIRNFAVQKETPKTDIRAVLNSPELCRRFVAREWNRGPGRSPDRIDADNDGGVRSSGVALEFIDRLTLTAAAVLEWLTTRLIEAGGRDDAELTERFVHIGDTPLIREIDAFSFRSRQARTMLGLTTFARQPSIAAIDVAGLDAFSAELSEHSTDLTIITHHRSDDAANETAAELSRIFPASLVVALVPGTQRIDEWEPEPGVSGRVLVIDPDSLLRSPQILENGPIELMARLIHLDYVSKELTRSRNDDRPPTTSALTRWSDLSEALKESNRGQARSIGDKLALVGCKLETGDGTPAVLTVDEIDRLAAAEHDRWMREQPDRSHPSMVPYRDLPASEREKDKDAIVRLPALAALLGFTLVRRV